jgi:leader peptidase (prepilin peptidase)/N-methyltransferase
VTVILGAILGAWAASFVGLAAWRQPRGLSVVRPASFCPACRRRLAAWETLPVVGWLLVRGRCRLCRAPIPWTEPALEALGACLGAGIAATWGWTPTGLVWAVWAFAWLGIARVDAARCEVPLGTVAALAGVGVAAWAAHAAGGWVAWSTASGDGVFVMAGLGTLALIGTRGRYGGGDVLLGLVLGWYLGPYWAVWAWLTGNVLTLPAAWRRWRRGQPIPFAPGLAGAAWLAAWPALRLLWWHLFPTLGPGVF